MNSSDFVVSTICYRVDWSNRSSDVFGKSRNFQNPALYGLQDLGGQWMWNFVLMDPCQFKQTGAIGTNMAATLEHLWPVISYSPIAAQMMREAAGQATPPGPHLPQ